MTGIRCKFHSFDRGLDQLLGLAFGRLRNWEFTSLDEWVSLSHSLDCRGSFWVDCTSFRSFRGVLIAECDHIKTLTIIFWPYIRPQLRLWLLMVAYVNILSQRSFLNTLSVLLRGGYHMHATHFDHVVPQIFAILVGRARAWKWNFNGSWLLCSWGWLYQTLCWEQRVLKRRLRIYISNGLGSLWHLCIHIWLVWRLLLRLL